MESFGGGRVLEMNGNELLRVPGVKRRHVSDPRQPAGAQSRYIPTINRRTG
jgi:hypothetical protein